MNTGDTVLDQAVYLFIFQVVTITEHNSKEYNKNLSTVFNLIEKMLLSEKLTTGLKYTILSSFVNHERGS